MKKFQLMQWIFLLLITFSTTKMNAQENIDALNSHQKSMISIVAYTSVGDLSNLKTELNTGLDAGLKVEEIKEALVQLYAYCGFPRSLSAINTLMTVLEERKAKGINDKLEKSVAVENKAADRYEQGRKVLEELTKMPQTKPAKGFGEFAPRIDAFLKEHLFADVFSNNVLNFRQRELVTISALASITGVEAQLQSHITMGKNTGITDNQLVELADVIEAKINRTQANTVRKIIGKPLLPIVEEDMMVRISEIEILPEYLEEYKAILKEEASASVKIEPGVLAIFPMSQKENPHQIRIIEIYANKSAYQSHLKTPHFLLYKTSTLKMVKDLKLIDMNSLDKETMLEMFKKLK